MDTTNHLVRFSDVRKATGLQPHVLTRRIQQTGIQSFIDGKDRRQRMIDVRDLPKLTAIEPVAKRASTAA